MNPFRCFNPRPLPMAALGFMGGILLAIAVLSPRDGLWILILLALLILLSLTARLLKRNLLALGLLFCGLGVFFCTLSEPPAAPSGRALLLGTIAEAPDAVFEETRLILRDVTLSGKPYAARVELTVSETIGFSYGQRLALEAAIAPLDANDFYRRSKRIGLTATADDAFIAVMAAKPDLYGRLIALRAALSTRIGALFPENANLAKAMLLGDKRALSHEDSDALYAAGIGHLSAVSGLHVGVLFAFVRLFLPRRRPKLRLMLAGAFLFCYALVTALSPSVLRAGILILSMEAAFLFQKRFDAASALALGALVILTGNPFALFQAGFQLSFLAMYGLITLYPVIRAGLDFLPDAPGKIFCGSLAVLLASFPASARFFGEASLVSLVTNLIALPLAPVFLVPAFVCLIVSFLCFPAARVIALLPAFVLACLDALAAAFSVPELTLPAPSGVSMLLFLAALALLSPLCLLEKSRKRGSVLLMLALSILCW